MRSLTSRLVVALLAILLAVGIVFVWLAKWSSDRYHHEITQRLNAMVASYIVNEEPLLDGARADTEALERLAHMAMIINPIAEIYLLDAGGRILGHALPARDVLAERVDTTPIRRYLDGSAHPPVFGDDPRNPGRVKVFSVAPIDVEGARAGYVYVVLGGAKYQSEAERVLDSHVLRISLTAAAAVVAIAGLAGLIVFRFLTRRLRRLAGGLRDFEEGRFRAPVALKETGKSGDEIDALAATLNHMSRTIVDQIERLQSTDRTRRELIANVSHDLRTPIASMNGYLDTLLMKHDELSERERERYLRIASRHSEHLGKLVEDLFQLSRLDSGLIRPRAEPFSLSELVQDVAQKYQLQAAQARVTLAPHVDEGVPLVSADIGMIEQVLENLIGNALKHTPPSGTISIRVTPDGRRVATVVTDTGHGIASEDLPHIFDRAYTGASTAHDARANAGLGLAIVKRILDLHDCRIEVSSHVGRGAAFRFELPVAA